jgi:endonuclease G
MLKYLFIIITLFSCKIEIKDLKENNKQSKQQAKQNGAESFQMINKKIITKTKSQWISHKAFDLCYSNYYKIPLMVTWKINYDEQKHKAKRLNNFRKDPYAENSTSSDNYRGINFDRGHICPAEDMAFSDITISESFYMTNIAPQYPDFNRHSWSVLENQTRNWSRDEKITVIAGSIPGKDWVNGINIPQAFYRIVYNIDYSKYIAIIMQHENKISDWKVGITTIDNIEEQTGFNFFHYLEDSKENQIEKNKKIVF